MVKDKTDKSWKIETRTKHLESEQESQSQAGLATLTPEKSR